jgi:hypothetical protein
MSDSATRSTKPSRSRDKCRYSCDALGSGVCTDCQGIVSRRTNAEIRRRGMAPDLPVANPTAIPAVDSPSDSLRSDLSTRLQYAAELISDGDCSLESVFRLVASTVHRKDRIASDGLVHGDSR